jgi:hypothetical protein
MHPRYVQTSIGDLCGINAPPTVKLGKVSIFTFLSLPDATMDSTPVFFAFMLNPLRMKAA